MTIVTNRRVSVNTMFHNLSLFIVLLSIVIGNNGQKQPFEKCDHAPWLEPEKKYYVSNDNYPGNYTRGSFCRWILSSDRPMKLTCEIFNVPSSENCEDSYLEIGDFGYPSDKKCGNGKFTVTSESNRFQIIFSSSLNATSGNFFCSIETATLEPNCQCGWKNPTGIAGSPETGINEYPMMARIIDPRKNMLNCGATIVNERQLLTAAHCMENRNFTETRVSIGDHDSSTTEETNATQLLKIRSVQIHPDYNSPSKDYDLALITIDEEIRFSRRIGPVCLPFYRPQDLFVGSYAHLLGWGVQEFSHGLFNTLQKARMGIITNEECSETFANLTTRQMCNQEPGINPCQFESGGPVLWENPSSHRFLLIGVIHGLYDVCAEDQSAQSTRVGSFIRWIESEAARLGIEYCKLE